MKHIEFDVELSVAELYRFTMRHTYFSISGVFSLAISLVSLVVAVLNIGSFSTSTLIALLIVGALFTVVQPLMLYVKCSAQIKQNKSINAPLHYTLGEEGILIVQKEQEVEVKWYDIRKVVHAKKGLYLYMSPVRAFIFPKEQCGEKYQEIGEMTKVMMDKYKDYVPEEDESTEDEIHE